jgi:rhomboid protease GluP
MSLGRAPVTIALLATNILVFLIDYVVLGHGDVGPLMAAGAIVPDAVAQGEYYRIFTAGFLHFSLMHIGLNMYALAISGMLCETLFGSARFSVIYFAALVAGGVLAYETSIGTQTVTAGASGAIMGLFGAIAALGIKTPPLRRTLVNWALFPIIATLLVGFTSQGISNAGHVGGLIAGAIAGFILPARVRARGEMQQS